MSEYQLVVEFEFEPGDFGDQADVFDQVMDLAVEALAPMGEIRLLSYGIAKGFEHDD